MRRVYRRACVGPGSYLLLLMPARDQLGVEGLGHIVRWQAGGGDGVRVPTWMSRVR